MRSRRDPQEPSSFTLTTTALLSFAELALGYDFAPLRRVIAVVIRSERGASAGAPIVPDRRTVFACSLVFAPQLVSTWSELLLSAVSRYGKGQGESFIVTAHRHRGVRIVVRLNVVEAVLPPSKSTALERHIFQTIRR